MPTLEGAAMPELSPVAQTWVNVVLIWVGFGSLAGLLARVILPLRGTDGLPAHADAGHHRQRDRPGLAILDSRRRPIESHQSARFSGCRGGGLWVVARLSPSPRRRASPAGGGGGEQGAGSRERGAVGRTVKVPDHDCSGRKGVGQFGVRRLSVAFQNARGSRLIRTLVFPHEASRARWPQEHTGSTL